MAGASGIFADHALRLRWHGLAVLPIGFDKRPLINSFNKWRVPPSVKTVKQLSSKFPNANLAFLPGLSGPKGLYIVDVDDAHQEHEVETLFGTTPVRVLTSRGVHLYYRNFEGSSSGTLRKNGLNVDLKAGNSIVIAPPSRHESGAIYRHGEGSDWSALERLPTPNLEALKRLLRQRQREPFTRQRPVLKGKRHVTLNGTLCAHVWSVDTFDDLLDFARTQNDAYLPPNDDAEVVRLARDVWEARQEGRIQRYHRRTTGKGTDELLTLCRMAGGVEGSQAFALLTVLTALHSARCRRGETFSISARPMAEAQVIPGFTEFAYRRARNLLLKVGLIELVAEAIPKRQAAQYTLSRCRPASCRNTMLAGGGQGGGG